MEVWEDERERRHIAAAVRYLWEAHRMAYFPVVAMVYAMACEPGSSFDDMLWTWTEYDHKILGYPKRPQEEWRSEVCRRLLMAGADTSEGIERWFEERAKEVREIED